MGHTALGPFLNFCIYVCLVHKNKSLEDAVIVIFFLIPLGSQEINVCNIKKLD